MMSFSSDGFYLVSKTIVRLHTATVSEEGVKNERRKWEMQEHVRQSLDSTCLLTQCFLINVYIGKVYVFIFKYFLFIVPP